MPFSKNDPNINRQGRPKTGDAWADVVREMAEKVDPATGKKYKHLVVEALFRRAVKGDIRAIREIGDRLDGRVNQQSQVNLLADAPVPILQNFDL